MTDKELLELAAKAAGIDYPHIIKPGGRLWNPLTDDGDALRLAVKLLEPDEIAEIWNSVISLQAGCELTFDANRATRRAIVFTAAEIGKDMK